MKTFVAASALLLAAACALTISQLEPFPCAKDGSCPKGYVCAPGEGCVPPRVDARCQDFDDCGDAGECVDGVCTQRCSGEGSCPSGRVCSRKSGQGTCLADCTSGQTCPGGSSCQNLWYGKSGCAAAPLSACQEIVRGASVACGATAFTVRCSNGNFCPQNSRCSNVTGGGCNCNAGFTAYHCGLDEVCAGSCSYPSWGCYPAGTPPSCAARNGIGGSYLCADGRTLAASCDASCEEACSTPIDAGSAIDSGIQGCGPGTNNTCPDGCCIGNTCYAGTEDFACGSFGLDCAFCASPQTCQSQQCAAPDAGAPDAGQPDSGAPDAGPQWSSCTAQTSTVQTCSAYCASISRSCVEQCTSTVAGSYGARAWDTATSGCPGDPNGHATCGYNFSDSTPLLRWQCCCQ